MIAAGQLRERVLAQQLQLFSDAAGGEIAHWLDITTIAAQVQPIGGDEALRGDAVQAVPRFAVTIRHQPWLTVRHRFIWRGRILNIRALAPDRRRATMLCDCDGGEALGRPGLRVLPGWQAQMAGTASLSQPISPALMPAAGNQPQAASVAALTLHGVSALAVASALQAQAASVAVVVSLTGAGLPPALPELPPITIFVAPETGSESNDGSSAEAPIQYPPGDPRSTSGVTISPGDHVAFKGGEALYLQDWRPPAGTAEAAIVISGNAWGDGRCSILGASADLCTERAPLSAADAGWHDDWDNGEIVVVSWDDDDLLTQLYDGLGALQRAQYPRAKNRYQYNDNFNQPDYYIGLPDGQTRNIVDDAVITDAGLAGLLRDWTDDAKPELWINRSPNQYQQLDVIGVDGNDVLLSAWPLSGSSTEPYPTNSNLRPIIRDRVTDVQQPGDWCLLGSKKALCWKRAGGGGIQRAAGSNALGALISGRILQPSAHTTFRGFELRHATVSTGKALVNWTGGLGRQGFRFIDNVVRDCVANDGAAAIDIHGLTDVRVTNNRFYNLGRMSGVQASAEDGEVAWNAIYDVNATALRGADSDGHRCRYHHNILSRARGVHANGRSNYQTSDAIVDEYQAIIDCPRPFTAQEGGKAQAVTARTLRHSLLKCVDTEGTTPVRIDGTTTVITIDHVLMIGPDRSVPGYNWQPAVHVSAAATNVTITNSFMTGSPSAGMINYSPTNAATYDFFNNVQIDYDYLSTPQAAATIADDQIDVIFPDGFRLQIDLRGVGV